MIFETLLEDFKRANLAAKGRLAAKYGFSTPAEYLKYLEDAIKTNSSTSASPGGPKVKKKKKEPKIKVDVTVKVEETETDPETITDMVIAFDTTGSMASYIASVRKHVEETIKNLFTNTPGLKLKIVAFGDYCDMMSATNFGYAYQETALTDDQYTLINFVRNAANTGGGDSNEFYELVLQKILDETPWREGSNRAILLIADDSPHPVGYSYGSIVKNAQVNWRDEARKAGLMKVRVDTMRISAAHKWYEELSRLTEGTCMEFKSSHKTQQIVEASTYLNSMSKMSIDSAKVMYRSAVASGDDELVGAYKGMAADRGINLDEE